MEEVVVRCNAVRNMGFDQFSAYDLVITPENVVEFGIDVWPLYTKRGTFKKWARLGYVYLTDSTRMFHINPQNVAEIADMCEANGLEFTKRKHSHFEDKDGNEIRATSWEYSIEGRKVKFREV